MVVQSLLQRNHQVRRDVVPVQLLERIHPNAPQIGAPQLQQWLAFKGVELQIDLEVFRHIRQPLHELFILRDANPIGVDHQMPDGPGLRHFHNLEKLRVHRRLASGNLYHVGMALIAHHCVEHLLNQSQVAKLLPLWPARGVAHRAAQVAVVTNLYQRQAGVLLMVRA